jgi:hypothetical protein
MPGPTKFMTRHQVIATARELGREGRDVSGNQHGIRVSAGDQESMDYIGAGAAERNARIGGDDDALGIERILHADEANRHRTSRVNLSTEILLDKFTSDMQSCWINGLDAGGRHTRPVYPCKSGNRQDDSDERD